MANLWPSSLQAQETITWIAILGGIVLMLLAYYWLLDKLEDWAHTRIARRTIQQNVERFAQGQADLDTRLNQAKWNAVIHRTGSGR